MFENIDQFCIHVAYCIEWLLVLSAEKMQGVALYFIWIYSVGHTNTVNTIKYLSKKYTMIEHLCNRINGMNTTVEQQMAKLFSNQKFEPTYAPWIDVVWITTDNNITEEYFDFSKEEKLSYEYMHSYYNIAMAVSVKKSKDEHGIIIMKYGDKIHCNLLEQSDGNSDTVELIESNARFLTIEYRHPSMTEGLFIDLDRSWFVSGNQLLSRVFVRRYLEYQSVPFYFDKNYTILLIDDNMNFLTMNSNQYVLLEKDSYKIMEDSFEDRDEQYVNHDDDDGDDNDDDNNDNDDNDDDNDDDGDDDNDDNDDDGDDDDTYEDAINKIDSNYISE